MRDGRADIGQGLANPDAFTPDSGANGQDGHPLPGMIRALPGRVATVVRRQDAQVAGLKRIQKPGQTGVKSLERPGIPGHVPTMTMNGIKINEIRHDQCFVFSFAPGGQGGIHEPVMAVGADAAAHSAMGEDVSDLAHAHNRAPGRA